MHVDDSRRIQHVCRDSERISFMFYLNPTSRLQITSICFDFTSQLILLMLAHQTVNEFFTQNKGCHVNLFGLFHEGLF